MWLNCAHDRKMLALTGLKANQETPMNAPDPLLAVPETLDSANPESAPLATALPDPVACADDKETADSTPPAVPDDAAAAATGASERDARLAVPVPLELADACAADSMTPGTSADAPPEELAEACTADSVTLDTPPDALPFDPPEVPVAEPSV